MELAISRQAVAEWRDRQILSAAALLNQKCIEARAAFELEAEGVTAAETIFNHSQFAKARIDALLGASLTASLPEFLELAARELSSIDPRLKEIASALVRPNAVVLPAASEPPPATHTASDASQDKADQDQTPSARSPLTEIPARLARRAARIAQGAGSAADDALQDTLGLKKRLRSAAAQRVARAWMGEGDATISPLQQLVDLIDETSHAARVSLS